MDRGGRRRRVGLLAAAIAAVALAVGLAGTASAVTIDIPAQIVIESQAHPGTNDPGRCIAWSFMQFNEVAGATHYEGLADGTMGSSDVPGSGPPFPDDEFSDFPALFIAPAGTHRFALGGSSVGSGCADAEAGQQGRFSVVYMRAEVPQAPQTQSPVARFTATRDAANPRLVRFDGSGSSDPDGGAIRSYAWTFGDGGAGSAPGPAHTYASGGRRTVTLTVTDDEGETGSVSQTVDTPFDVRGTLRERICRPSSCRLVPVAGARVSAAGTGSAEATSDRQGRYRLLLDPGSWTLTPQVTGGAQAWDPASRSVSVGADLTGQDFVRCAAPAAAVQAAAVGGESCTHTLKGQVRSAIDGRPFGHPARSLGSVQLRIGAFDASGGQVDSTNVADDGTFELVVPTGTYALRLITPDGIVPVHGLPSPGLRVVADRDRTDLVVRVRPTLGTFSVLRDPSMSLGWSYWLEVFDTTPFGTSPGQSLIELSITRDVPLLLRNTCSGLAGTRNSLGTVSAFVVPRKVPQGPGFLGPEIEVPLCRGTYRGTVWVRGARIATFSVAITGGHQPGLPLENVRYDGRFRG